MLEPVSKYSYMARYRRKSEQTAAPAAHRGDRGHFAGKSTLQGRKGCIKSSCLSSELLLAAAHPLLQKKIGRGENDDILTLKYWKTGIERHSFSPCTSKWYDNSKFLPFYFFIAMRDIQTFHRRWVKAIQSVCLPLIFPLIYSSAPIVPPLRAAVTNPSLLCLRGQYLQPLRGCTGAALFIIWQTMLSQAIPLAISISMTKYAFYASGFQPHRSKCFAGPLFLTMEMTSLVQVVFITHFCSKSWVVRKFTLKYGLYPLTTSTLLLQNWEN